MELDGAKPTEDMPDICVHLPIPDLLTSCYSCDSCCVRDGSSGTNRADGVHQLKVINIQSLRRIR